MGGARACVLLRRMGRLPTLVLVLFAICAVHWVADQYLPIAVTAVQQWVGATPPCLRSARLPQGAPNLSDVALVTCLFPVTATHVRLSSSPHPLGAACSFLFTNAAVTVSGARGGRGWTHRVVASPCADDVACAFAAKPFKIRPSAVPDLLPFAYVLYVDHKIDVSRRGFLNLVGYVPQAPPGWALMVRHHEVLQYRDNGLEDELWFAMLQPRYRQALPRISRFLAQHPDVPRRGVLHNSGLLLWNLRAPAAAPIQEFWYNATLATSPECQATFFYTYHKFRSAIVTIPFPQDGVAWYRRATSNPTTRASLRRARNATWWAAHHGGPWLGTSPVANHTPAWCRTTLPYSFNYPLLIRDGT